MPQAAVAPAGSSGKRMDFVAFVSDEETRDLVATAAERSGTTLSEAHILDIAGTVKRLEKSKTPERMVIDVRDAADPMVSLEALSSVCDEGTRIIVLGTVNDVNIYRTLIAAGIDDYLVRPLSVADVSAALRRQRDETISPDGVSSGELITVIGARGGVGATTVAVNLAWSVAHEHRRRTALLDLDLYFGSCAIGLDLEPSGGLREVLANSARVDELFVERAMIKVSDTLSVLAPGNELVEDASVDPAALGLLVKTMRRAFDVVIIDLPRFAARSQVGIFEPPFSIVIVADPSLPALRDEVRLRTWFEKLATGATTHVVLNRVGAARNAELSLKEFQTSSGIQVAGVIPNDVKAVSAAVLEAKPCLRITPKAPVSKAVRSLAVKLVGKPPAVKKAPAWKRLLRRRR